MYSWFKLTFFFGVGEGGGSPKKITFIGGGGSWKKFCYWGGVMQLFNDSSKNPTSPPYLVKNERSLMDTFRR